MSPEPPHTITISLSPDLLPHQRQRIARALQAEAERQNALIEHERDAVRRWLAVLVWAKMRGGV